MQLNYRLLLVPAIVAGLSIPAIAAAQAIPRTSSTSGDPGGAKPEQPVMSAPMPAPSPMPQPQQPVRSAPPPSSQPRSSGSSSGGGSGSTASSGSTGAGSSAVQRGGNTSSGGRTQGGGGDQFTYVGAGSRNRDGRPISNTAVRRSSPLINVGGAWLGSAGYPFSPWGNWYPWYSGGYGYGYVSYNPWSFGGTRFVWGRYGLWWYDPTPWYDPWYDPWFMYGGYGAYGGYGSYGGGGGSRSSGESGSLRIKVNPDQAQVYIDGVLQGVVDDFNGLSSHLEVSAGTHQLELRAAGYVTLKDQVTVESGQTQTYRGSLKKSSK